jgi:hypothetical protein
MLRSFSRRPTILILLGFLSVSQIALAAERPIPAKKSQPAHVLRAGEDLFARLGRLVHSWAANGAIVDPMGHPADGAPTATVPTGNPSDDNGAIIDPMG